MLPVARMTWSSSIGGSQAVSGMTITDARVVSFHSTMSFMLHGRSRAIHGHFLCQESCDGLVTPQMDKYSSRARSLSHDLSGSHVESPEFHHLRHSNPGALRST